MVDSNEVADDSYELVSTLLTLVDSVVEIGFITAYCTCPVSLLLAFFSSGKNRDLLMTHRACRQHLLAFIIIMLVVLFILFIVFSLAATLLGLYSGLFLAFRTSCSYLTDLMHQLAENNLNDTGIPEGVSDMDDLLPSSYQVPDENALGNVTKRRGIPKEDNDPWCIAGVFCVPEVELLDVCDHVEGALHLSVFLLVFVFLCMLGFFFLLVSYGANFAWVRSTQTELKKD